MRRLRRDVGMTQQALADAIGIRRETIVAMEQDKAPIETRTALAVIHVISRQWQPIGTAAAVAAEYIALAEGVLRMRDMVDGGVRGSVAHLPVTIGGVAYSLAMRLTPTDTRQQ